MLKVPLDFMLSKLYERSFSIHEKGTAVQIIGDMNIGVYNHPEKGPVPTANCRVLHIDLLPSKNKENQG